jgi:ribulose 1,5-bisphosphate carboxylase large subunit-like protein
MSQLDAETLHHLWFDFDKREVTLRQIITERLAQSPPPRDDEHIIATYFFAFRSQTLDKAVEEISYHATSGIKHPPPGSLLEACSAKPAGVDPFDSSRRIGLLNIAFPLKMLLQPDGHLTSCDILHTVAAAIIFDVYENLDARLVALQIPEKVIKTFPGPAYGPFGLRELTGFDLKEPVFGTILKPTAGVTPEEEEKLVEEVAAEPLFMFIKEDEDLYPNLDYSPVRERARRALAAIQRVRSQRQGKGLVFATHISGAPHEILETMHAALEEGVNGLMFSETFAGGTVRMVREATKNMPHPPAIYGHNAGIGVKTRSIWREVIDWLARLDGIDFRQTAPVRPGAPFIRPYGQEWEADEAILSRPIPGIRPTMIARAGALDQGNIGLNLADAEERGLSQNILFLAGSAISSIVDGRGQANPKIGAQAMRQAIAIHKSGEMAGVSLTGHLQVLMDIAVRNHYTELQSALRQRYPEFSSGTKSSRR